MTREIRERIRARQKREGGAALIVSVLMLVVLSALLYLTNKQIWAPVKKAAKSQPAE